MSMDAHLLADRMVDLVRPHLPADSPDILGGYMDAGEYEIVIGLTAAMCAREGISMPSEVLEFAEWIDEEDLPEVQQALSAHVT